MEDKNQKVLIVLGTVIVIALLISLGGLLLILNQNNALRQEINEINQNNQQQVDPLVNLANPASVYCEEQGGILEIVTDADGGQSGICKLADGSVCEEWAYFRGECPVEEDKVGLIRQVFAVKYNKNVNEITININKETDNHVRGGVIFNSNGMTEGGYFLAAKVGGKWEIVIDGNGAISCQLVNSYNFPQDMIGDCY